MVTIFVGDNGAHRRWFWEEKKKRGTRSVSQRRSRRKQTTEIKKKTMDWILVEERKWGLIK